MSTGANSDDQIHSQLVSLEIGISWEKHLQKYWLSFPNITKSKPNWWLILIILALGQMRQDCCKFMASLGYIVSSRSSLGYKWDTVSKQIIKTVNGQTQKAPQTGRNTDMEKAHARAHTCEGVPRGDRGSNPPLTWAVPPSCSWGPRQDSSSRGKEKAHRKAFCLFSLSLSPPPSPPLSLPLPFPLLPPLSSLLKFSYLNIIPHPRTCLSLRGDSELANTVGTVKTMEALGGVLCVFCVCEPFGGQI